VIGTSLRDGEEMIMVEHANELPMEYAVEMNRLLHLQMEGSVG